MDFRVCSRHFRPVEDTVRRRVHISSSLRRLWLEFSPLVAHGDYTGERIMYTMRFENPIKDRNARLGMGPPDTRG